MRVAWGWVEAYGQQDVACEKKVVSDMKPQF